MKRKTREGGTMPRLSRRGEREEGGGDGEGEEGNYSALHTFRLSSEEAFPGPCSFLMFLIR